MVCLHVWLCTVCVQYSERPEEGTELNMNFILQVKRLRPRLQVEFYILPLAICDEVLISCVRGTQVLALTEHQRIRTINTQGPLLME